MKKILAIILTLSIFLAAIPLSAVNISAATSGTTGSCTWSLNGTTLTISGNGAMNDFPYYHTLPWGTSITKVIIEEGVTHIGVYAFSSCSKLASVTIPDSVTSIGDAAFKDCSSLTSISIPDSVTSIGNSAFWGCSKLTSVTIPDSVTNIEVQLFLECSSLTSVTIPDSVTSIGNSAFEDCTSLTSVTIPDSVTSIGSSTFSNCTSLEEITLPFVGSTLNGVDNTHFGYIFYYADLGGYKYNSYKSNKNIPSSLKKVTITGGYAIDEYAFDQCNYIEEIVISDTTRRIYSYAFKDCRSLKEVTIPQSVTSIDSTAFYKCEILTINCVEDSYAETFAKNKSIPYAYITASGKVNGDVNCDGVVDTTDLAVLKLHLAGIN